MQYAYVRGPTEIREKFKRQQLGRRRVNAWLNSVLMLYKQELNEQSASVQCPRVRLQLDTVALFSCIGYARNTAASVSQRRSEYMS